MHEVASDYTLALTVSTSVPDPPRLKFASAQWPAIAAALLRDGPVGPADVGEEVVTHRSSWVRRRPTEGGDVYIKTYCYNTWGARLRNMAKHTAPCRRSRAAAEAAALLWLAEHGFPTAEPLAVLERRRLGFVVEAVLVTRAQPGTRADHALAAATPAARTRLVDAIGEFVRRLHAAGFRDRNLDLRNLLLHDDGAKTTVAKIDSPRHRIVRPGRADDRLARADWRRLLPQLAAFTTQIATPG